MAIVPCKADLGIASARVLTSEERRRALSYRRLTSIVDLCSLAGVPYRVTGGAPPHVATWNGPGHAYTVNDALERVLLVDATGLPQRQDSRALRILEILAFAHNDYYARETICGRGYFVSEITPEHGRAWLQEIGRRGGARRSEAKMHASRKNGARARL